MSVKRMGTGLLLLKEERWRSCRRAVLLGPQSLLKQWTFNVFGSGITAGVPQSILNTKPGLVTDFCLTKSSDGCWRAKFLNDWKRLNGNTPVDAQIWVIERERQKMSGSRYPILNSSWFAPQSWQIVAMFGGPVDISDVSKWMWFSGDFQSYYHSSEYEVLRWLRDGRSRCIPMLR